MGLFNHHHRSGGILLTSAKRSGRLKYLTLTIIAAAVVIIFLCYHQQQWSVGSEAFIKQTVVRTYQADMDAIKIIDSIYFNDFTDTKWELTAFSIGTLRAGYLLFEVNDNGKLRLFQSSMGSVDSHQLYYTSVPIALSKEQRIYSLIISLNPQVAEVEVCIYMSTGDDLYIEDSVHGPFCTRMDRNESATLFTCEDIYSGEHSHQFMFYDRNGDRLPY